jgi:RND family efflux transporter MFP subunit
MFRRIKKLKSKLGRRFWIVIILAVLLLVFVISGGKNKNGTAVAVVKRGTVSQELILTGQIGAEKHATLSFPTSGKIAWVGVAEGQTVRKGQALVSLDTTTLNAAYQQALNNYRNYQAAAESALDSVKDHSADETYAQKATRTAAESARDSAYDAVVAAEYNLKNSTLYAPFAGVVASLPFPSPGVNVTYADPQVEVVDPASIYFEVEADQSDVVNIQEKQKVMVVLDSYRDKEFSGIVSFVGYTPRPGEAGTIYKVKVEFVGDELKEILPRIGMTGDARFTLSQKNDVLYVPPRFVNSDKDGRYVNLGSANHKVRVSVGIEGEDRVEITGGVKEGDTLYD